MAIVPASSRAAPGALLYDYEVTGADKATIDTNVDGAYAGLLSTDYLVLEVWFYGRTDEASTFGTCTVIFNNDSGANYERSSAANINASFSGNAAVGQSNMSLTVAGNSDTASIFAAQRMTIPNYAGTVGFKAVELTGGAVDTTAAGGTTHVRAYTYLSAAAVRRLTFASAGGQKFKVGTRLLVYAR